MEFLEYVYVSLLADAFTLYRVLISQAFCHGLHTLLFVSVQYLLVRLFAQYKRNQWQFSVVQDFCQLHDYINIRQLYLQFYLVTKRMLWSLLSQYEENMHRGCSEKQSHWLMLLLFYQYYKGIYLETSNYPFFQLLEIIFFFCWILWLVVRLSSMQWDPQNIMCTSTHREENTGPH